MQKSSVSRLLSLIIATVVIYQSAVVAPIINIYLPVDAAAKLLRAIWPIFFALIGLLGDVGAVISRKERVGADVNVATALSMAICYGFVPFINEARDSENLGNNYSTLYYFCLLYTSPSPRDKRQSRMPSSA